MYTTDPFASPRRPLLPSLWRSKWKPRDFTVPLQAQRQERAAVKQREGLEERELMEAEAITTLAMTLLINVRQQHSTKVAIVRTTLNKGNEKKTGYGREAIIVKLKGREGDDIRK